MLRGEIDSTLRDDVHRAIVRVERSGLPVVVEARDVTFIDSSGLAFLLHLRKVVRGAVVLEEPAMPVVELLSAVGLASDFPVRRDVSGSRDTPRLQNA